MRKTYCAPLLPALLLASAALAQPSITGPIDPMGFSQLKDFTAHRSSSNSTLPDWNDDSKHPMPGETMTIADLTGPGIVTHIWTTASGNEYGWPRLLRLRVYYDGSEIAERGRAARGLLRRRPRLRAADALARDPQPLRRPLAQQLLADAVREVVRITLTNEGTRRLDVYYHVDWQKVPSLPPRHGVLPRALPPGAAAADGEPL